MVGPCEQKDKRKPKHALMIDYRIIRTLRSIEGCKRLVHKTHCHATFICKTFTFPKKKWKTRKRSKTFRTSMNLNIERLSNEIWRMKILMHLVKWNLKNEDFDALGQKILISWKLLQFPTAAIILQHLVNNNCTSPRNPPLVPFG